jgi:endonuclease YncB( thermonuclease family)
LLKLQFGGYAWHMLQRGMNPITSAFFGFTIMVVFGAASLQAATVTGTAHVIDGDTIAIGAARVRIHGIDAPETGQRCELTEGQQISCDVQDVDTYGRLVSVCHAGGQDVGKVLVEDGLAWAFVRYSEDYLAEEAAAQAAGRGIWRGGARPTTPWEYRADRWERAAAASPRAGCPIKGNISQDGEQIYHTPWSPWYGRTQINESQGERWFCDENEAAAAGWRPARTR